MLKKEAKRKEDEQRAIEKQEEMRKYR